MQTDSESEDIETPVPEQSEPNVAELLEKMEQRMSALEKKLDVLIRQSAKPAEARPSQRSFPRPAYGDRRSQGRPGDDSEERVLHKVACSDCKKECEVPFRPTGVRPVYCQECFRRRKEKSPPRASRDDRPRTGGERTSAVRKGTVRKSAPRKSGPSRDPDKPFYKKFAGDGPKSGAGRKVKKKHGARAGKRTKT